VSAIHTTATARALEGVQLHEATKADLETVERWAATEGRNPGTEDARLLTTQDPDGFLVGHLDDRLVCSVSIVRYGMGYAHLGNLLVAPDMRGHGLEKAAFTAALRLADGRTIGGDAAPEQLNLFRRYGFAPAELTARYKAAPAPQPRINPHVTALERHDYNQLGVLDAAAFPAPRHALAIAFAALPGRHTLVYREKTIVRGYGVLRPAHSGMRIGPLYADSEIVALALLDALSGLAASLNARTITIDIPLINPYGIELARSRGLHLAEQTRRMYRPGHSGIPTAASGRSCSALTSLELG
jgi:GNAT superfamily N-acetyltransferase